MRVLIVDQESAVRRELVDQLEQRTFNVTAAPTVAAGLELLLQTTFDVAILSVELEDRSGLEILRAIRQAKTPVHVIAVSTHGQESNRVDALDRGADDYLVKPFSIRELVARIGAVRRHETRSGDRLLMYGRLAIDLVSRTVTFDRTALGLTPLEFNLLAFLAARPGHVFSRHELLVAVWKSSADWQRESTVTEHVRTLRAKLERNPGQPRLVQTVRGVGYRFDPPSKEEQPTEAERRGRTADLRRTITGVVSEVSDAVIVTDPNFQIVSWNAAAERLYGWAEHEVLGRRIEDVLRFVGSDTSLAAAKQTLSDKGRWFGELSLIARDGSPVDVWTSHATIRDELGEPTLVAGVHRPVITSRAVQAARGKVATDESAIRLGLAAGEFTSCYEPIVVLQPRHIVAVAARASWNHPARGQVTPADLMDPREHVDAFMDVERMAFADACEQTNTWRDAGLELNLALHLSNLQLADATLFDDVSATLARTGLSPGALWLEVTETALVEDIELATELLTRFEDLGTRIAVDNFGIGWASLTYLQELPVHALKIDRHFVASILDDHRSAAITRSIVGLGQDLGLAVIAVGVVTDAQDAALQALGCRFGQGPLYGSATSGAELSLELVRQR